MSVDLSTDYLGLQLRNPLVLAASPLTTELHNLQRFEEAGAAAAVMSSLFAEQIESHWRNVLGYRKLGPGETEDAVFYRELDEYNAGPDTYLRRIEAAKKTVSIPIIGSLNGSERGDWVHFAHLIQEAGADALELNIYFVPASAAASAAEVEDKYLDLVAAVRAQITIPLAVKLSPFFSSLPHFAARLVRAGANGLVLFNRFLQPDIDLQSLEVAPRLTLSTREELRLPLRWIAILRGQLAVSMAGTSGVHFAEDVLKLILAGADVAMLASALIRHGPHHLTTLLAETTSWLENRKFKSLAEARGFVGCGRCANPEVFERANYAKALVSQKIGV
jgi:dihydroorotate dehydrogenase (fumarate)